jgi:hypothetical protein
MASAALLIMDIQQGAMAGFSQRGRRLAAGACPTGSRSRGRLLLAAFRIVDPHSQRVQIRRRQPASLRTAADLPSRAVA